MTAKEKAIELVEGYFNIPFSEAVPMYSMNQYQRKQCAIIHVAQIIEEIEGLLNYENINVEHEINEYWHQVKTEIEKL